MRAVIQRVSSSSVTVEGKIIGEIGKGVNILLGVTHEDSKEHCDILCDKIIGLRIFEDNGGKMNLSLKDVSGAALVISQFTLYADCKKGRRPSFTAAAGYEKAKELYEYFVHKLREKGVHTACGEFGSHMQVSIVNDGPVTIILDSDYL